jgi:hypothetical protein
MAMMASYQGVVKKGRIRLAPGTDLPEDSRVFVVVADDEPAPLLDAHLARRKANGWLISYVGHFMAQQPKLTQLADQLVWQFGAFLAQRGMPRVGPVGFVYVDAYGGDVLNTPDEAEEMITHATTLVASLSPAES